MNTLSIIICVIQAVAWASDPTLESVTGSDQITVIQGKTKTLVKPGRALRTPARIQTNGSTTAVVLFSDGSKAVISKNTDVEILKPVGGTQWNKLNSGFVRTEVAKSQTKSKKFLFGYKTKSAVMGVRGTVFDIEESANNKKTELRTLEGDVQIAKDEKALTDGKGQSVKENQFSVVDAGKISSPVSFNKDEYLNKLLSTQPELVKTSASALSARAQNLLGAPKVEAPQVTVPAVTIPPVTPPPLPQAPAKPKLPF